VPTIFSVAVCAQIEGLNWMLALASRKLNGILADEMGLGKTLQAPTTPTAPTAACGASARQDTRATHTHARARARAHPRASPLAAQTISVLGVTTLELLDRKPHLVIVPLSVLGNWQREFAKWCPALKVVKLHGDKEARQHAVQQELRPGTFNVCVTTCARARRTCPAFTSARRAAHPACPRATPGTRCSPSRRDRFARSRGPSSWWMRRTGSRTKTRGLRRSPAPCLRRTACC